MAEANNNIGVNSSGIASMMYYRVLLSLFGLGYIGSLYFLNGISGIQEFLVPRSVFGVIAFAIVFLSFFIESIKKYINEILVFFLALVTVHLIFFLFQNNFNTHIEFSILALILFTNLHISSMAYLVLYNVIVLCSLELMLISESNKAGNPVAIFASVSAVIIFSVLHQLFSTRGFVKNKTIGHDSVKPASQSTPTINQSKDKFDTLPVAICVTDLNGKIISSTNQWNEFLAEKNITTDNIFELLNEDEQLAFQLTNEKQFIVTSLANRKLYFKKDNAQNLSAWILTNDNSLQSTVEKLKVTQPTSHYLENFPSLETDANGRIVKTNEKFESLTGYSGSELNQLMFGDLMHPIDVVDFFKMEKFERSEKRIMHKSGKVLFLLLSCVSNSGGTYSFIAEDVTDVRETQRQLQTSKANVTSVIENTHDLIFSVDTQSRITVMNTAFKKHFAEQYEKEVSIGDDYKLKLPEQEKRSWIELMEKVLRGGRIITQEILTGDDGKKMYYEVSLNPIIDDNNMVTGASYFARDVTQRMIYESEIIKAKEVAEDATNAKSQFLATMSHEIRTPLNGMLGMLELLRTTTLNSKQKEYVNTIKLSGESLMNIINDVLDFSKIESDKMHLDAKPFNLRKVVEETFDIFYYRSLEKQLELFYSIDANIPPAIVGDSIRLKQILINLVGNALKFTEKGHILIKAELANVAGNNFEIKFSVKDTGIGISRENIDKLFTAFTQADASTYRRYGGTGLGLTISNKLVSMMNGKIWVESSPGEGSTFYFTIQSSLAPDSSQRYSRTNLRLLRGKVFILISSNAEVKNQYQLYSNDWGIQLSTYNNARETLAVINDKLQPDAILIDASIKNYLLYAEELRDVHQSLSIPLIAINGSIMESNETVFGNKIFEAVISSDAAKSRIANILFNIFTNPSRSYMSEEDEQDEVDNKLSEKIPAKILVAEDNPINQTLAEMVLGKLGYKIEMAGNGKEALQKISTNNYDLVFMDVQMPEMDGMEATENLRKQDSLKQPIVIAMTAFAMQSDKEKCIEAGMNDYISKPIRIEDIQSLIIKWKDSLNVAPIAKSDETKDSILLDKQVIENLKKLENGNGNNFVTGLLQVFARQVQTLSDDLKLHFENGNINEVYKSAHKLKGSSLNVGARKLAAICEQIEIAAKLGNKEEVGLLLEKWDDVISQTKNAYDGYKA